MPGMSPRMKAKKGRYGVDGLAPTVSIQSPAEGFEATAMVDFTATASAYDDNAGNVSAAVAWSFTSVGAGVLTITGSPAATVTVNANIADTYMLTASITVGDDTTTHTINITAV